MCWMIYQPEKSAAIPDAWLNNAWSANNDGAGYCFSHEGKLIVRKPFYKLKELRHAYATDHKQYGATSPFVLHMRYSTHGNDEVDNIHPHVLSDGQAALCHNGILTGFIPPAKSNLSDTAYFCKTVLMGRTRGQLLSEEFANVLAEMIGVGNKFVLMDCVGNVTIPNTEQGLWIGEYWLSNNSHEKPKEWKWKSSGNITRGMSFTAQEYDDYQSWAESKIDAKLLPCAYQSTGEGGPVEDDSDTTEYENVYDQAITQIEALLLTDPQDLTVAESGRLSALIDWWLEQEELETEMDATWDKYKETEKAADDLFDEALRKDD